MTNKEALDEALEDPDIEEIEITKDITDNITVTRDNLAIDGNGNKLTGTINLGGNGLTLRNIKITPAAQMETNTSLVEVAGNDAVLDGVTIEGMTTSAESNDSKNPIFGIKVAGENAIIKDSTINGPTKGKAYSMIFVDKAATGALTVEGNTFKNLDGVRNVLEFNNGYAIPDGTVIKDNKFVGDIEHTAITMMNFKPNAHVVLENNTLNGVRISNTANANATIDFIDGKATFNEGYSEDWGLVLIQQLGNEDYSKMTINVDGFRKEDGTLYTENSGKGKDLFLATYSSTGAEHKLADEKAPMLIFEQGHDKVLVARNGNDTSYGKKVSEYQTDIKVSQEGKLTGTLLYATDIVGAAFTEGNALAFHINKDKLPLCATDENIKIGWSKEVRVNIDPSDYNALLRVDTHKGDTLKIFVNDEVVYEYDLSGLTLNNKE